MRVVQFLVRLRPAFEVLTPEHCSFFNRRREKEEKCDKDAKSNFCLLNKNNVHLHNVAPLPYCSFSKSHDG